MELRHLRYFLAVAEERNFTRAAKRLHMAQPPLTRQIRSLEVELGVTLFDRSSYHIELTHAGELLAAEVREILQRVTGAVDRVRQAARGDTGGVRVGFTESASFNELVPRSLQKFRARFPEVDLMLEERESTELSRGLVDGRIDAAFVRPPLQVDEGIQLHLLASEEMVVAVPVGHRLATRKEIALLDLAAETFILYPRSVRPGLADQVIAACEAAGFSPKTGQYAPQLSSTVNLVAASLGISIVPQSMQRLQANAVQYLHLRGAALRAQLGIAHRSDERAAAVLNFVALARAQAERTEVPDTS